MTAPRRDGNESRFSAWIRGEPRLDSIKERLCVMDRDYWIHQYRAHTDRVGERKIDSIMCVELKEFEAQPRFAQRDTLQLLAAMYVKTNYTKDGKIRTIRLDMGNEIRLLRMYGYFVLRLETNTPETGWIEWQGRQVDIDTLVEILSFKRDPRTLYPRSERRHHVASVKQIHPDLFLAP